MKASEKDLCSDYEQYTEFSEAANLHQSQKVEFDGEVGTSKLNVASPSPKSLDLTYKLCSTRKIS